MLLAALVALLPTTVLAQWNVIIRPAESGNASEKIAIGRNDDGDTLRVRRTADDAVEVVFALRPGLSRLADGCPSYRVDEQKPRALVSNGDMCRAEGREVTFVLGHVRDERVDSAALLELMNGSRIRFIYHVHGTGYAEAAFSLAGSKQAITEALGDVAVSAR